MASRNLQDSNIDKAGYFTGELTLSQTCEPCMKTNISTNATVFCKNCDEYLCDACKNPHTVYKSGQHEIVNCQDKKTSPVKIDMKGIDTCHEHGREIEFFCQDHSKLCCSSCVLIHRKCDQVVEIAKVSGQKGPELKALKQTLIKLQSDADTIITDCKQSETDLNESIAKISLEVDTMRDRIIKLLEEAKQKLITEAKQFQTAEVKRILNKRGASSRVKEEISKVVSMCCVVLESGTPSQQYIYSELMKEKRKTMISSIHDQRKIKFASAVTVSFPKELMSLLQLGSNVIKLNYDDNTTVETSPISLQPKPITLELLVCVDLHKTGDDEEMSDLTGLDFLPDGRLAAVYNEKKQCIILNKRLQTLGTPYKFKTNPLSVVCMSHDALCVTSGQVVYLLSVSKDNLIRLTREINTSSNYDSICCKSPSSMVVSTFEDPRHARLITMNGVETDFDHVVFPKKTYKFQESMCTYVQSKNTLVLTDQYANTVFMYDTVKGTSKAVTAENIQLPSGVCVGPGDTVLVCSKGKNSIVQLTIDGQILGTFPVEMWYPYRICVSKDGTRMAVSNSAESNEKLHMYKMSPAINELND